jgi:hypothetical protein
MLGRQHMRQSSLADVDVDWQRHGVEPRWLGMESVDCVAALQPSIFHSGGGDELRRFLAGCATRAETALIVTTMGYAYDDTPRSVLHPADDSVSLPDFRNTISGTRLLAGMSPTVAPGGNAADRDLGLRLLNRASDAPWWALELSGATSYPGDGGPATAYAPDGELYPVLVDPLGIPVVAVWVPSDEQQRWYVIPDAIDWDTVADWLVHQALPAYVPDALRRFRAASFVDLGLQTPAESMARQALADMEIRHAEERTRLEAELARAEEEAEKVRYGLIYGTGSDLVEAIDTVLTAAGFTTVNLDDDLGGTRSADLLVAIGQHRRLVEVKSQGGNASESHVSDLKRHLDTWRELQPQRPVGGGALIINHQHKLHPDQRSQRVYERREFVNTLTVPVIATRDLFDWWKESDWAAIQHAVLDTALPANELTTPTRTTDQATTPPVQTTRTGTWS